MEKGKSGSVVRNMMIALLGGLIVGIGFLFLREMLVASGHEGIWNTLNHLLFQDITAPEGVRSIEIGRASCRERVCLYV